MVLLFTEMQAVMDFDFIIYELMSIRSPFMQEFLLSYFLGRYTIYISMS